MKLFYSFKARQIVSALSLAVLSATPLTSAMAEDGSERLRGLHKVAQEQKLLAESSVNSAASSDNKFQQSKRNPSSMKPFQKRHRQEFTKRNGR